MHILILGAGALGSLIGGRLCQIYGFVTLYTTNLDHVQAIRRSGLILEEQDGRRRRVHPTAIHTLSDLTTAPDIVLVLVKTYATEQALAAVLPYCVANSLLVTLQNGQGNWQRMAELAGNSRVAAGTTALGATLLGPGRVRHGGDGPTWLGSPDGPLHPLLTPLATLMNQAGLETHLSEDIEELIWRKLVVNVGINAITALTGIRNGVLHDLNDGRALCQAAVDEALRVLAASGWPLPADSAQRVLEVAHRTAGNLSSMAQDVQRHRNTEIEAINGAVVRLGQQLQIPCPVNETLVRLIRLLHTTQQAS